MTGGRYTKGKSRSRSKRKTFLIKFSVEIKSAEMESTFIVKLNCQNSKKKLKDNLKP